MRYRRWRLGAGALLSVLLLMTAAAVLLGFYYTERAEAQLRAESREAGRVFAFWFQAAHRASMEVDYRVPRAGGGFDVPARVLTPAELELLGVEPPGLPQTAGRGVAFSVGIIDDGAGVPMAFGVVEPEAWANTASLREGALEGGLAAIEEVSGSGTGMAVHLAAIETALGQGAAAEGFFVTADASVRYDDRVVYRRAQPGHTRLNRMETGLKAGGCGPAGDEPCDLVNGGRVAAEEVIVTPDAVAPEASTVGGEGSVATELKAGSSVDVVGTCSDAEGGQVLCSDPESTGTAVPDSGLFTAVEVSGPELTVVQDLAVGSAVSVRVSTVDMGVRAHVQALRVDARRMTAQDATVETSVRVTGASSVGTFSGSTVALSGSAATASAALGNLYGPSANIGTLTVGSCAGCYPP